MMQDTPPETNKALREATKWRREVVHRIEDPELAERLQQGIEQAQRGETRDLGDFSQYLDTEEA